MTDDAQFIIKEDKYTISIIKSNNYSNKKAKGGISIFKKTLELNELNEDNINILMKNTRKEDFIYSYANIGLISISGIICFAYCTLKDIKEIGTLCSLKIYQIKNIRFIILDPEMDIVTKREILKFFKQYTAYELNKGLIFAHNLLNLDLSFDSFYNHFYDINKYICHINPNINFCYNYNHMNYFKKFSLEDFSTHIISGYYFQNVLKNPQKEDILVNLIIKDIDLKEFKNNADEKEKYLRQIEIILTPNKLILNQFFHFLFFSYMGNLDNKIIYNLLKNNHSKEKIDNGGVIVIDIQNLIKNKNIEEINKFIKEATEDFEEKVGNNYKILYIQHKNQIKEIIEKNKDFFEEIKYNYELKGTQYIRQFQKKQLLIVSDNEINSLNIIENIIYTIKYKFLNEYEEMQYKNEINQYLKDVIKLYRNYIKIKNNNFLKLEKIPSQTINDEYFNRKTIFIAKEENEIISQNQNQLRHSHKSFKSSIKLNEEKNNLSINNIIEEKKELEKSKEGINKFTLYIVTNNVGNYDLENEYDEESLKELLFPKEIKEHFSKNNFPTFYCIGLQEIVKLNTSNIIFAGNKNYVNLWENKITQILQSNYNYTLQCKENLVGILFLFFVKTSQAKNISNINKTVKKAGFLNKLGNKGYILYEFKYKKKKYSFCTGHLTAGQKDKNFQNRVNILIDILNHKNENECKKFFQSDFYFLFGDMNFRVKIDQNKFFKNLEQIQSQNKKVYDDDTLIIKKTILDGDSFTLNINNNVKRFCSAEKNENKEHFKDDSKINNNIKIINTNDEDNMDITCKRKIEEEQFKYYFLNKFVKNEELNELKRNLEQYDINEEKIKFLPTYKYIKGYDYYDLSKRIPSWTDRILFKKNEDIKCLYYDKIGLKFSDHRPVYALFEIQTE